MGVVTFDIPSQHQYRGMRRAQAIQRTRQLELNLKLRLSQAEFEKNEAMCRCGYLDNQINFLKSELSSSWKIIEQLRVDLDECARTNSMKSESEATINQARAHSSDQNIVNVVTDPWFVGNDPWQPIPQVKEKIAEVPQAQTGEKNLQTSAPVLKENVPAVVVEKVVKEADPQIMEKSVKVPQVHVHEHAENQGKQFGANSGSCQAGAQSHEVFVEAHEYKGMEKTMEVPQVVPEQQDMEKTAGVPQVDLLPEPQVMKKKKFVKVPEPQAIKNIVAQVKKFVKVSEPQAKKNIVAVPHVPPVENIVQTPAPVYKETIAPTEEEIIRKNNCKDNEFNAKFVCGDCAMLYDEQYKRCCMSGCSGRIMNWKGSSSYSSYMRLFHDE